MNERLEIASRILMGMSASHPDVIPKEQIEYALSAADALIEAEKKTRITVGEDSSVTLTEKNELLKQKRAAYLKKWRRRFGLFSL